MVDVHPATKAATIEAKKAVRTWFFIVYSPCKISPKHRCKRRLGEGRLFLGLDWNARQEHRVGMLLRDNNWSQLQLFLRCTRILRNIN